MVNLPKKAVEEFKKPYAKHYGVELPDEEAKRRASNLVDLFAAVYGDNSQMINKKSEKT